MTSKVAYILLDKSGSMAGRVPVALDNIRTFVSGLVKEGHGDTVVKLYAFSSGSGFGSLSDALDLSTISVGVAEGFVTPTNIWANGGTPLYDAIGKVAGMALANASEKGSLIIFTDGCENTSKLFTLFTSKACLDAVKARGWQVEQVGIEYDVTREAFNLGTKVHDTYVASAQDMARGTVGMALAATRSAYYGGVSGQSLNDVATSLSKGSV